jgi:hypothetical protein
MPQTTIRVARRQSPDEGCSNNPIVAIEKMQLDTYVRGVLPPEIGVFRNIDGVEEVYRAFALAAKSYGLWFTLYYDADNRRRVSEPMPPDGLTWFHIDDTACNQRYSDNRLAITNRAASDTTGQILVRRSEPNRIDKYEYAASCGGHGTRPAYQQSLVDDATPTTACVGDWCGHTDCAGHEDNPNLSGADRCLVRGMCQWGAAEWAKSGKDYRWILDHYQPNLMIRPIADEPTVEVTGFVYTDPENIERSGVSNARVDLSTGSSTRTNSAGRYTFRDVPLSAETVTITASKAGYRDNTRTKMLTSGERNWASIRLRPEDTRDAGSGDVNGATADVGVGTTTRPSFGALVSPARRDVSGGACSVAALSDGRRLPPVLVVFALGVMAGWRRLR